MMTRKVLRALSLLLLFAAASVAPLAGQVSSSSPTETLSTSRVEDVLRQGRQLESGEQWAEALSHYEDALRDFPNERELKERHDQARIQFDLGRRYHDASFRRSVSSLSRRDALAIYGDVLLKIDSHYVHAPDWRQIVEHGTKTLDAALLKDLFVKQNLPGADGKAIAAFRAELRKAAAARQIRDRLEARETAAAIADLAQRKIGLSPAAVIFEYTCGAASALDSYSTYLTADQLRDVFSQIEGRFVGLGIEIKATDGALSLVHVITGSPASKGGLKAGDRILAVDGRSTKGVTTDGAAGLLQGEDGSICTLSVARAGQQDFVVRVRRAEVDVPSIEDAKVLDPARGVAFLKVSSFQKTTARDLDTALWQLHSAGMKSLIIDLRGNPGGLLTAAVDIADKFVMAGTLVSTRGRSTQEDFNYTAHRAGTWNVPLVVLVDGDSASASEIFAAAIQDNRRGTIVGRRSYGKGSVQGIFPLSLTGIESGGVRLTTAKFYGPSGRPISGAGVTPDVVVQTAAKPESERADAVNHIAATANDADIQAALQIARGTVASR